MNQKHQVTIAPPTAGGSVTLEELTGSKPAPATPASQATATKTDGKSKSDTKAAK